MLKGFKDFVLRGNVIDLAVAVVVGAAFKSVVDAFVEGVVNPTLGFFVGKPNFDQALILGPLRLGFVLTSVVNFLLTAAVIYFFLVMPMRRLLEASKKPEAPPAPPPITRDQELLTEIRDLLKNEKGVPSAIREV